MGLYGLPKGDHAVNQPMTRIQRKRLVVASSASLNGLPMGPAVARFEAYERERNRVRKAVKAD